MAQIWHSPTVADIEAQKHWELEGVERGVRKVREEIDQQRVGDSQIGSALARRVVPKLIVQIEAAQAEAERELAAGGKGRPSPWWYQILLLPADKLAVITIKKCLSFRPKDFTFNPTLTNLAHDVARGVLDQLEYEDWRKADKKTVDRFFDNYQLTPRNLKRLREKMGEKREALWDTGTGVQFGVKLITLLADAMPEWFKIEQVRLRGGRFEYQLTITEAARDVLLQLAEQSELSQPSLMPMICPPAPWRYA